MSLLHWQGIMVVAPPPPPSDGGLCRSSRTRPSPLGVVGAISAHVAADKGTCFPLPCGVSPPTERQKELFFSPFSPPPQERVSQPGEVPFLFLQEMTFRGSNIGRLCSPPADADVLPCRRLSSHPSLFWLLSQNRHIATPPFLLEA